MPAAIELDAVIFGGGVAGLWLLDELRRRGYLALLLEAKALGAGQTIASQGILHGGAKYVLSGVWNRSAREVREMPAWWRACLAGRREPDLSQTRVDSACCYLWRTDSLSSRLGMLGARVGLQVAPQPLGDAEKPPLLARCPGAIARLDEQVIDPADFVANLSRRNYPHILRIDADEGLEFDPSAQGASVIRLFDPVGGRQLALRARRVVLTAGAGNAILRQRLGLPAGAMQRRPLHLAMVRGMLPAFYGHCVDGAATRVTITSRVDSAGRTVWQIGGGLAEAGTKLDEDALVRFAQAELRAVLPGLDLQDLEWAGHRVDRAERAMAGGRRPDTVQTLQEGNVITAWPTKLVLAPKLAEAVVALLPSPRRADLEIASAWQDWPRPAVANPPWEICTSWRRLGPVLASAAQTPRATHLPREEAA